MLNADNVVLWGGAVLSAVAVALIAVCIAAGSTSPKNQRPLPVDRQARLAAAAGFVFILGTFTWRSRTVSDLNSTPVDAAGGIRLLADAAAFALAVLSLWARRLTDSQPRSRGRLVWLYGAFIAVAAIGVPLAVEPQIVVFRVAELGVCVTVAVALARSCSLARMVTLWRWALLFMAALIVGSALLRPSIGLVPARGGIVPIRLEGVFPEFSANSVGLIGTLLVAVSLASERRMKSSLLVGVALVVLSQYRTGYISVALVVALYLLVRGSGLRRMAMVACLPLAYLAVQTQFVQNAWIRGEAASDSTGTLSGRTIWWDAAFSVAQRSPIFGTGLSSGTRNEVLAGRLGLTETSTIHGTWIEAYVGTGIVGTAVLLWFVLAATRRAWQVRRSSMAPLLMVPVIVIRSLTGSSIELASVALLAFLTFAFAADLAQARGDIEPRPALGLLDLERDHRAAHVP